MCVFWPFWFFRLQNAYSYFLPIFLLFLFDFLSSFQFSSVAQSCPTLGNPTDCSTPGLPVHYQLSEFTSPHVHRVSDAIQAYGN